MPVRRATWVPLAFLAVVVAGVLVSTGRRSTDPAVPVPPDLYDPVAAGEELPNGYRRSLARDQIPPVYDPEFTAASGVDWPSDSLVIGVAGKESAKAYPVNHLSSREMVIDSLEGIPILVTW